MVEGGCDERLADWAAEVERMVGALGVLDREDSSRAGGVGVAVDEGLLGREVGAEGSAPDSVDSVDSGAGSTTTCRPQLLTCRI